VEPPELTPALLEHQRIRARAPRPNRELRDLIETHIRLEERFLFQTIDPAVASAAQPHDPVRVNPDSPYRSGRDVLAWPRAA
jgi:hypothetical protein